MYMQSIRRKHAVLSVLKGFMGFLLYAEIITVTAAFKILKLKHTLCC